MKTIPFPHKGYFIMFIILETTLKTEQRFKRYASSNFQNSQNGKSCTHACPYAYDPVHTRITRLHTCTVRVPTEGCVMTGHAAYHTRTTPGDVPHMRMSYPHTRIIRKSPASSPK